MGERRVQLMCPVVVNDEGDLCEKDIDVWVEPRHPGSRDEPPTEAEINDVRANNCDHGDVLRDGTYNDELFSQLEDSEE